MSDRKPTLGQRTQLERIGSDVWVLVGVRDRDSQQPPRAEPRYELRERGTGRVIQTIKPAMVASLVEAGWIAIAGGDPYEWSYRITQAGIEARDRGSEA